MDAPLLHPSTGAILGALPVTVTVSRLPWDYGAISEALDFAAVGAWTQVRVVAEVETGRAGLSFASADASRIVIKEQPLGPQDGRRMLEFDFSSPAEPLRLLVRNYGVDEAVVLRLHSLIYATGPAVSEAFQHLRLLFDRDWYLQRRPDAADHPRGVFNHYMERGLPAGEDPSPLFDGAWYRAEHPEISNDQPPVLHYFEKGAALGFDPSPIFDRKWYLAQHTGVATSGLDPLVHYATVGLDDNLQPSLFNDVLVIDRLLEKGSVESAARLFSAKGPLPTGIGRPGALALRLTPLRTALDDNAIHWTASEQTPKLRQSLRYLAQLNDFHVVGGSNLLLTGAGEALSDELAFVQANLPSAPKLEGLKRAPGGRIILKLEAHSPAVLDEALHLMKEHDANYYHWCVEVLTRLVMAEDDAGILGLPVLVTDGLHANLYELLDLVSDRTGPLLRVARGAAQKVRRLVYPSDVSFIADTYDRAPAADTNIIPVDLLRRVISRVRAKLPLPDASPHRLVYLDRKSTYRRLTNDSALKSRLIERGFEIVDVAGFTATDQIRLMGQARCVVGPTGAAMTNLIWRRPTTPFVVLNSDHPFTNEHIWRSLAEASPGPLRFLSGPRAFVTTGKYGVHDDFEAPISALDTLLDDLL